MQYVLSSQSQTNAATTSPKQLHICVPVGCQFICFPVLHFHRVIYCQCGRTVLTGLLCCSAGPFLFWVVGLSLFSHGPQPQSCTTICSDKVFDFWPRSHGMCSLQTCWCTHRLICIQKCLENVKYAQPQLSAAKQ